MIHRWENLFLERPLKIWSQFFFRIFLVFNLSSHKLLPLKSLLSRHYSNPSLDIAFVVGWIICNIFKLSYKIVIINVVNITIIGFLQINPTQKIVSSQIKHVSLFFKDTPYNCAQTIHVIPADQNFEKKRSSSALFVREINLVTQPSFDCEQGINSQVQTVRSNADAVFPVLGIVFCKNERFSLSRKTHVPLWTEPRISHVRLL